MNRQTFRMLSHAISISFLLVSLVLPAIAATEDMTARKNLYDCQQAAAEYTYNLDKSGEQELFDKHVAECLKAKKVTGLKSETDFTACTGSDAAWCSPCWNDPKNTWCCKNRKSGGLPDCGSDYSTCIYCPGCHDNEKCTNLCTKPAKGAGGPTNIKITNKTDKDVTIAFVTAASGGACANINRMISYKWVADNTTWCKGPTNEGGDSNAGYCTGVVPSRGSVEVKRLGDDALKCLSGSILLGGKLSCPTPNGFTQGEFTFNPTNSDTEAVDISLVNGANYALSANLPGEAWAVQDGGINVSTIGPNEGINGNNNKNGIFPPGCTDCIQAIPGQIPCPQLTPNPQCQQKRICNIYRGGVTGGTVEFVIERKLP